MEFVYYFSAAILIWLSYKSFRGGQQYLAFFRKEIARPRSEFTPFVSVIVPCRGIDDGLDENIASVFSQDYPAYEVIFVVDDVADPSLTIITRYLEISRAKLVVAPKATKNSQKVKNLCEAVSHIAQESKALVLADSDARASVEWLRSIIAPLQNDAVGASTGYRWFIPTKPTLASELRSVWNASVASSLGADRTRNFCWGGSMAIRRNVFEQLDIRERWANVVSDDFAVTVAMRAGRFDIVFVPHALNASVDDCTFAEMLEFTTRQMKITRVYSPRLWLAALLGSAVFCGVTIATILILLTTKPTASLFIAAVATLVLVSAFSIGKSWLRHDAVRIALRQHDERLRRQQVLQAVLWPLAPFIFLFNSIAAAFSRRIRWREITYELKSRDETVIIAD